MPLSAAAARPGELVNGRGGVGKVPLVSLGSLGARSRGRDLHGREIRSSLTCLGKPATATWSTTTRPAHGFWGPFLGTLSAAPTRSQSWAASGWTANCCPRLCLPLTRQSASRGEASAVGGGTGPENLSSFGAADSEPGSEAIDARCKRSSRPEGWRRGCPVDGRHASNRPVWPLHMRSRGLAAPVAVHITRLDGGGRRASQAARLAVGNAPTCSGPVRRPATTAAAVVVSPHEGVAGPSGAARGPKGC